MGRPCGGAPWGRSASGRGAQAAPVVRLLPLSHAAQWRTVAGEQNHVSTLLSEMVELVCVRVCYLCVCARARVHVDVCVHACVSM